MLSTHTPKDKLMSVCSVSHCHEFEGFLGNVKIIMLHPQSHENAPLKKKNVFSVNCRSYSAQNVSYASFNKCLKDFLEYTQKQMQMHSVVCLRTVRSK